MTSGVNISFKVWNNYPAFNASTVERQTVTVTGERSFEAAMRLYKEKPGRKFSSFEFMSTLPQMIIDCQVFFV